MSIQQDPQWLEARKHGIGSSDASAVCGCNQYRTAYEVYMEKTGQLPAVPMNAAMEWGLRLEPAIAQAYQDRQGIAIVKGPPMVPHPECEFMFANPDWLAADQSRIVELKTAGIWSADQWGDQGTDEIPEAYLVQVQYQMLVLGIPLADVAVLIAGQDFRVYHVERNAAIAGYIEDLVCQFWDMVQRREPPEPDWEHESTVELMKLLHPVQDGLIVEMDPAILELVEQWERTKEEKKAAEEAADFLKAKLLHAMGPAAIGQLSDGRELVRKTVSRKEYTVKASEYTTFSVRSPKRKKATV